MSRFTRITRAALLSFVLLASPLAASAAIIYAPSTPSGGIVGFNLQNTGTAQSARYISFGQPFVQGAVSAAASLTATIGGVQSQAQMDVKTTYPDGSVRFAVITVLAPALSANQTVGGFLATGGSAGTPINLATALGSYNVSVNLSGGVTQSINVTQQLQSALSSGKATYWLKGPLATQARVDVPVTSSLHVIFDITAYADGSFSTDAQFNNDYAMQSTGGTLSYVASIAQNGSVAYTSPSLKHYQYQHWHKVVYSSAAPAINVQHSVAYLLKTGVFPNYDLTTGVNSNAISALSYTPLGSGGYAQYMPGTGDRYDIGPTTLWNAHWLLTQDKTAAQTALAQADTAGSIPWHYFDPSTGEYLSLDNYPTLWADGRGNPTLKQSTQEPSWEIDTAHTPDASFVPYVLTGARVYLDQLNAQATAVEFTTWNGPREDGKGLVLNNSDQVRAQAWMIRSIDEAAWANPDGTATKSYWNRILNNNYDNVINNIIPSNTASQGAVRGWFYGENRDWPPRIATWQHDYLSSSIAASALRGNAKALTVLNWMANFSVGRVTNEANGMNPAKASQYEMAVASNTGTPFITWAQVGSANSVEIPTVDDFPALVSMALASIYNATGNPLALQGYNTFEALHAFGDSSANYSATAQYQGAMAKFHIVPVSGAVTTPPPTSTTPTATLTASPTSITSGQSSALTWVSTNATSCTGTGFTASGTSGSATVSPTANTTYTIVCTGAGGSASQSTTVTVTPGTTPPPTPTKFVIGDRVQVSGSNLNVRSTPSTSGTLLGTQNIGAVGTVVGGPITAGGYTWWNVDYDNAPDGWSVEDYLIKSTTPAPTPTPAPSASLSASPTSITSGQSATLTWSSTNATSCTGSGFTASGTAGSVAVSPTGSATYAITCTGTGGSASASASVGVTAPPLPTPTPSGKQVCVDSNCSFSTIQSAFSAASNGSTITISGEWTTGGALSANNVTIKGLNGAHLKGGAVQGKGIMVITGSGVTIQDLECSNAAVPDENGACVRFEGSGNLTVRNVNFHDNQDGILAAANTGVLTIENSIFNNNGYNGSGGYAHGVYMNGAELVIRNSQFLRSKLGGHEVKSRANKTTLENNVIATLDGVDSRNIDIPNGGVVVIRNNVIEQGPNSENSTSIGIGLEGVTKATNSILIEGNYIILERSGTNVLLQTSGMPTATMTGNTVIGGTNPGGANTFYTSRSAASIAAYPYLPPVPSGTTPAPTPTPTPTNKFVTGDRVATTDVLNVRSTASPTGTLLGSKAAGALGTVFGGPTTAGGYTWWNVDYDTAPDGWSVEDYLIKSTTPVPTPTPAPTVTLAASPTSITSGQSATLTWSSTNATSCTGVGFTTSGTSGSVTVSPTATATYSITCTGTGGTATAQANVTVSAAPTPTPEPTPTPTAKFNAGDRVQVSGGNLRVRSTPSTSGSRLGTQRVGSVGTVIGGPVTANRYTWWNVNYDSGADGWSVEDNLVKIAAPTPEPEPTPTPVPTPAPTATFSASPTSITGGQSSTLTWSSTNATSCTGSGFTASGTSGSITVSPSITATYSITCSGAGGTSPVSSATVSVTSATTPPSTVPNALGDTTAGTVTDSYDSNYINAAKYTSGSTGGAAQSISVYAATPIGSSPNNQFSLAIYADNGGTPGELIAHTGNGTLTGNAWNTLPITATIAPNTTYWLAYNTNGAAADQNNFRMSDGLANQIRWVSQTFGSWPQNFGTPAGSSAHSASIYLVYAPSTTTPPPATPAPTVTLAASPTSITSGQSATLTWSSTNATSCTGVGFTTSGTSGSVTVSPTATATYSITCTGTGGTATAQANVTVSAAPTPTPVATASLSASPTSITSGDSSTLTWSSTDATSCTGSGFTASGTSGSTSVSPTASATYSLTCTGAGGTSPSASASVSVSVAPQTLTFGNTSTGDVTDTGNFNSLEVSKYTSGSTGGTAQSISVYVAKPLNSSPKNQYSLAIYADNGGTPGALVAQTNIGTLTGDAWNTLPISASIAPNTTYWLGYTTNAADASHNNFRMSTGAGNQTYWRPRTFSSWPAIYGSPSGGDSTVGAAIYVTYTTNSQVLSAGNIRFTNTLAQASTGVEVTLLQSFLKKLGFFTGEPTGYYGNQTAAAVMALQRALGLEAVGVVGPQTRAILNAR